MAAANGLLEDRDMDTLESWIGTGPKQFTLLYKITRDGCNATTFHNNCDSQGPTVTVLYNPHGTLYGGYVKQSWNSSSGWITDPDAYLFQLKYNKSPSNRKFSIKSNLTQSALYGNNSFGPQFGGGNDLRSFTGSITSSGGTFALNGNMNINNTYDFQGLTADQINNNTMVVTELEVYKVTDGTRPKATAVKQAPWRETPTWNEQYLTELQEMVVNYKPISSPRVPQARILMVGPVGAGKSSFYNTINSVFRERITHKAISGSSDSSLTNRYTQYQVRTRSDAKLNFRLCDTRGLEENKGTDTTEFCYLLDGHIPDYYEFDPEATIKAESLLRQPGIADKIHCVAFVLDVTTLDVMSSGISQKIKNFQKQIHKRGIPQVLLLTKTDKLCKSVKQDAGNMLKSESVESALNKAADAFGIPPGNVLPVKNYATEVALNDTVSISAMLALQQMLNFADDFLDYQRDRAAVLERGVQRLDIKE